jgi:integral membrane protein
MAKLLASNLGRLRVIGFGEAISWILLLGIAMPLKYIWGNPLAVKYVGWIHGLLFMAYIAMAYVVKEEKNWPVKKLAIAFIAAFLPFGTFVFDARLKADQMANK